MSARELASVFCASLILASCSDRGQEMEEKVAQMQRQLDEAQKQLQAANQALAARTPAPATTQTTTTSSSGGLPSREVVEESYATSVNAFRKDLEANLKGLRLESCTTHSVQMPTEFFPFTSELSLALVSSDGKNFSTDIPVKADVTGKWIFPTVAEVTQRIESAQRVASGSSSSRATAKKEAAASGQPPPYMKVDGTFVIQWPDSRAPTPAAATQTPAPAKNPFDLPASVPPAPAASAPPPPSRPPPAQPQAPAQPGAQPVMPVDRDVHIQFGTPSP